MEEELCDCSSDLVYKFKEDWVRKVESRAKMRWLCVRCKKPLVSYKKG
jgi:DNA-directed RNA polymerase subunit RPC12/RpoP